jgi:anti-sigma regulatory factor (Ser/Thr protein kinase)
MAVTDVTRAIVVQDPSQIAQARRASVELASAVGLDEERKGRLSLVVTESGTNLLRHAGGGQILLRAVHGPGVEVLALDRGPGMTNVTRCMEDGYSTAGSAGTGLGAMRRLSSVFELYSPQGGGTAILCRVGDGVAPGGMRVEGVCVPAPGEEVSGDAWEAEPRADGVAILVVDGLGHGLGAAEAARAAVEAFRQRRWQSPARRLEAIHPAMRGTRGGAVAVVDVDRRERRVRFAGIGNIGAMIVDNDTPHWLMSHNGTMGHTVRKIDEVTAAWPARGVLVLYTDGLSTPREIGTYRGLLERHPSLVAGVLWRDLSRGRDDATVVVVKEAA